MQPAAALLNSPFLYMMAWFMGVGAAAYTIGNGLRAAWPIWAVTAGLALVGYLQDENEK